jgi:hypothetical protein
MQYLINLSEESDHFLRQLCDPGRNPHSEAVSVEDFLSAFVEEQLDELFVRRERRKTKKTRSLTMPFGRPKNAPKRGARLLLPRMLLLRLCVNSLQTERRIQRPIMGSAPTDSNHLR